MFCADSQWCLCARGGAGIGRGGEEGERDRQGAARVVRCKVGDVSNERVATGFENHGIIRQIKLERLQPFFFHSHIPRTNEMD